MQAYVYKWTHIPSGKWYIGSRSANGCHINDGYICSSKIVKPLIVAKPDEWQRKIIYVGDKKTVRKKECEILKKLNAKQDPMSYNQCNGSPYHNGDPLYIKFPDLHPTKLRKLGATGIANLLKDEVNPWRRCAILKFCFKVCVV